MELRAARLEALRELVAECGGSPSELARRIKKSPSQVSQWLGGNRTITEESAREIERRYGKPAYWMDVHPRSVGGYRALLETMRNTPRKMSWGDVKEMSELPDEFELVLADDAMAPRAPTGTTVRFRRCADAQAGLGVLVRDAKGGIHFRECRLRHDGTWNAFATNPAFPTFHNSVDELQVLAVAVGVTVSWSVLMR